MRRVAQFVYRPVTWWASRVSETDPLRQSAWERGKTDAATAAREHPAFGLWVTVIPAVFAVVFVSDQLILRLLAAGLASLLGYLAVPVLWACCSAMTAPRRQRDEARDRVDGERERYAINDGNWRTAFETKSEETEDLRGKLGRAESSAARVPELEDRVRVLEEAPHPVVRFVAPWIDPNVNLGNGFVTFAFGGVINEQSHLGKGAYAEGAHLLVAYYDLEAKCLQGPFYGRWRDAPSAATLDPHQLHTDTYVRTLRPNGQLHQFDIAMYRNWIFAVDAEQRGRQLDEDTVLVRVDLLGDNFKPVGTVYELHKSSKGLEIQEIEE